MGISHMQVQNISLDGRTKCECQEGHKLKLTAPYNQEFYINLVLVILTKFIQNMLVKVMVCILNLNEC